MRIDELLEIGDDLRTTTSVFRKLMPRTAELADFPAEVRQFHSEFQTPGEGRTTTLARHVATHRAAFAFLDRQACGYKYVRARPDATMDELLERTPEDVAFRAYAQLGKRIRAEGVAKLAPAERTFCLVLESLMTVREDPTFATFLTSPAAAQEETARALEALALADGAAVLREARTAASPALAERLLARASGIVNALAAHVRTHAIPLAPMNHWFLVPAFFDRTMREVEAGGLASLPPGKRDFLRAFVFSDEVSSGGCEQYFLTSAANEAPLVVKVLEEGIGCPDAARILREALEVVGAPLPASGAERARVLASLDEHALGKLELLDREFHDVTRSKITVALARFIEKSCA